MPSDADHDAHRARPPAARATTPATMPALGWMPLPRGARAEPLARAWLAERVGIAADALPLARDARNRPRLHGELGGLDVNWSHSGGWLLLAYARGVRVGVDVESLARARPRVLELAARWFHADEHAALAALPPDARQHAFLRLWCAKEAVLKAHGAGLAFGLHRLRFDGASRLVACDAALGDAASWRVDAFEPAPGFVAACAVQARATAAVFDDAAR